MKIDPKGRLAQIAKHIEAGSRDRAERELTELLNVGDLPPSIIFSMGNLYRELGLHELSEQMFKRVIEILPGDKRAYLNRGSALRSLGRHQEALESFQSAISIDPGWTEAHFNAGNSLRALGRRDDAIASYRRAIETRADYSDAYVNLGIVMQEEGDYLGAVEIFGKVLSLGIEKPQLAHLNRASAFYRLRKYADALEEVDRVLAIEPSSYKALAIQGVVLNELGRPLEALKALDLALSLNPRAEEPLTNRGVVLQGLLRTRDAIVDYEAALEVKPDHVQAKWNLSLSKLLLGDFVEGWTLYESRFGKPELTHLLNSRPGERLLRWTDIDGRVVNIFWEQGLGDSLQFVRFLPEIADRAKRVLVDIQPEIRSLVSQLDARIDFSPDEQSLALADYHAPLMSIPHLMKMRIGSIPRRQGYLRASPECIDRARLELGPQQEKFRIGLVWSGSLAHTGDRRRSIPLRGVLTAFESLQGVELLSLQKEVREEDEDTLKQSRVRDLRPFIRSFEDTSALCSLCDVVISVDTSVCHLAGALGVKTWVLLPFSPDFRWLLSRTDTPWYASMRLFRQPTLGAWKEVLGSVRLALINDGYCVEVE